MHASHGLVLVPPPTLTTRNSALAYVRGAVVSPICLSLTVFASCLGVGLGGIVGAAGAFVAVALLIIASTRYRFVRRHLDRESESRQRCAREHRRLKLLRAAGPVRTHQYFELRQLVQDTEASDPSEAARYELQDLLEHFAQISHTHQKCLDALRISGSHDLPAAFPIDSTRNKKRKEIQARRMRHREACLARIERLAEEIEAIDELIRLVGQRIACPVDEIDMDREVDRRLGELDEVDAAILTLSA